MAVAACLAGYAGSVVVARLDDLWWGLSVARQRYWSVVCSRATVGLRFHAVSTMIERVSSLRGCLLLKPEQGYLKVLLGNGTYR
jgi:hypothetical protein